MTRAASTTRRSSAKRHTSARVTAPLTWVQYEAGSDLTQTSTTFANADATNLKVVFTPASSTVEILANCSWVCASGMGTNEMRARWHDGTAAVANTDCAVQANAVTYRHEMTCIVTGLTPGVQQTWTLQIRSDGTHTAGIKGGTDYPVIFLVWDGANSVFPNHLAYKAFPLTTSAGGATSANITSTTLVRFVLEAGHGNIDLPAFVAPASGKVLVTMHGTTVTCTSGSVAYALGLWDIDAAAAVAGSAAQVGAGAANRRHHPHYRRIFTGLTPGNTYNWSLASKVITAGTNSVGVKIDVDNDHEGPMHMRVTALDI